MKLNPYLSFEGTCEEALNFYKKCLGGEFTLAQVLRPCAKRERK